VTELDSVDRIRACDWPGLTKLWTAIESGSTPEWRPGKALEYLVLRAFQIEGAQIEWPYSVSTADVARGSVGAVVEQVDGFVMVDGLACVLECKDHREPLSIESIAKLRNLLLRRPAQVVGLAVSRSGFTAPAMLLARFLWPQTILLWTGDEIAYALETRGFRAGLAAKYKASLTKGIPYYHIRTGKCL
jgi:hypothetical protein